MIEITRPPGKCTDCSYSEMNKSALTWANKQFRQVEAKFVMYKLAHYKRRNEGRQQCRRRSEEAVGQHLRKKQGAIRGGQGVMGSPIFDLTDFAHQQQKRPLTLATAVNHMVSTSIWRTSHR
ncbi:hypothetical protein [Mycobacterium sp. D16R24]|uniref:hypothetical protein n=1 Tax=Mycobacterium sp. D16R24 TaxID=1855656 RepID=UPI001116C274|nr:hypothetical protein [Mycobacterium sp. D16R24]